MCSDDSITVSIYRDDATANHAIPVFSFACDVSVFRFNLLFAPDDHICIELKVFISSKAGLFSIPPS